MTSRSSGVGRRPSRGVIALAVVASAFAVGAGEASAAQFDCPNGKICGWVDSNYVGARQDTINFRNDLGAAFNNKYSSAFNRTSGNRTGWENKNCAADDTFVLGPGGVWTNPVFWDNDDTESVGRNNCQ